MEYEQPKPTWVLKAEKYGLFIAVWLIITCIMIETELLEYTG